MVLRVWVLGFENLVFGVWDLGYRVWGLRVWGLGFGVWGLGFGVWGLEVGCWVRGFGVWGLLRVVQIRDQVSRNILGQKLVGLRFQNILNFGLRVEASGFGAENLGLRVDGAASLQRCSWSCPAKPT